MRNLLYKPPVTLLALIAALMFIASCKPKNDVAIQTPQMQVTNIPPVAEPIITNAPAATNPPVVIAPMDARKHIGDTVTVRGKVYDVHLSPKGDVFVNFGGKYPNSSFSAVCFQGALPTDELKKLNGKTISVTGKIKDYNGTVEIVLESMDQIGK